MNIPYDLPPELSAAVQGELEQGETVRWCEQPVARYFTSVSTARFLFAIPGTIFLTFGVYIACNSSIVFTLFIVPFLIVELGLLTTPIWTHRKLKNTVYLITDRRAVIVEKGRNIVVGSYPADRLIETTRRERRNGLGDVVFDPQKENDANNCDRTQTPGFFNVRNPKAVELMLKSLSRQES